MKLLLGENISRKLVPLLAQSFVGSAHVVLLGLQEASDIELWQFAKEHDYVIVSKDDDFTTLSTLRGRPPCLIKLSLGNCSNQQVLQSLLGQQARIEAELANAEVSMVELIPDGH